MLGSLIAALAVLARHDFDEAPSRFLAPRALGDRDVNGAARDLEREGCSTKSCIHGLASKYYIDFPRMPPKERSADSWSRGRRPALDETALAAEYDVAYWGTHVLKQYGTLRSSVCPGYHGARELGLLTCTMENHRLWLEEPARPIEEDTGLIFPASVRVGPGGKASDGVVKVTARSGCRATRSVRSSRAAALRSVPALSRGASGRLFVRLLLYVDSLHARTINNVLSEAMR